jgi:aryl-alcohol dehydrogenase-like predicted oxidoreductase
MIKTTIPGTALVVSRFIFGTASLFNAGTRKTRHRILRAAVDNGFTHFDTAPYYGFGMAERDLGAVICNDPKITVTTKVGIYPPGGEHQSTTKIILRKAAGRLFSKLSRAIIDFSVSRARRSLYASLQRLSRDHIEIFMLHEPTLALLNSDEWLKWLETEVTSGKVGRFGLALEANKLEPFLQQKHALAGVIQTTDSLDKKEANILLHYKKTLQITYGYVSAARSRAIDLPVVTILQHALQRNKNGAIIVSTTKLERLGQYQRILETLR